jgi:hypothetical protein
LPRGDRIICAGAIFGDVRFTVAQFLLPIPVRKPYVPTSEVRFGFAAQ